VGSLAAIYFNLQILNRIIEHIYRRMSLILNNYYQASIFEIKLMRKTLMVEK